jgi:hypothetical protein
MRISGWVHRRPLELVLAAVQLLLGIRTALPIGTTSYPNLTVKLLFAVLICIPPVWVFFSNTLKGRSRALYCMAVVFLFTSVRIMTLNLTMFASAGAFFGLMVITLTLCAGAHADRSDGD